MTLRRSLLISLCLVLVGAFCLFGLIEYFTLRTSLIQEVDRNLRLRAESVARRLPAGTWESHAEELVNDPLAGIYVEVLSGDKRVVYASPNLQQARLPWPAHTEQPETVDGRVRVYSLDTPAGTVLVGETLHYAPLVGAGKVLAAGALTLAVTLLVTSLVVRRGLQPLAEVAATARHIGQTGEVRGTRLPVPVGLQDVAQVAVAFNTLLERVEQLLETQSRLLADTSHELRNPLTVIRTDIDMLAQQLDLETRREVSREANLEVDRMIRLVEHLLLISWAESRPRQSTEKIRMDTLTQRLAGRQAGLGPDHRFQVDIPEEAVWVNGDADRLSQILTNLLDNAVRHTQPGTLVRVALRTLDHWVEVTIEDDGAGIPAHHLVHIFERFYRVDPSRSRGSGGAGLGLPLAQALARSHGGELLAASKQGCSFTLRLPRVEPD